MKTAKDSAMKNDREQTIASQAFACLIMLTNSTGIKIITTTLLLLLTINGIFKLSISTLSLLSPYVYRKDILQEYVMGKAILMGLNPYIPMPELFERILGFSLPAFPYPSSHPPPIAILSIPLALLSYSQAALAWYVFELVLIVFSVYLVMSWLRIKHTWSKILITVLILVGWYPIMTELILGQLMVLLFFLVLSSLVAIHTNKQVLAGILLGLAISLKIMVWPILVILIFKKYLRIFTTAVFVIVFTNMIALVWLGPDIVLNYYFHITRQVFLFCKMNEFNYSFWTIGWRVFEGTGTTLYSWVKAPPLIEAPSFAPLFSLVICCILFLICTIYASRMRNFDIAFAIMVALSLLISPITWVHYFVLLIIPLTVVARSQFGLLRHPLDVLAFISICLILLFSDRFLYLNIIGTFNPIPVEVESELFVPFAAGLITFIPSFAILGLIILLTRLNQKVVV